ncbi:MAG: PilZ domain-containing protein [Sphingomonas sp.]
MQARELRQKVVFNARMRLGRNWSDVVIRDLSSHGLLLTSQAPPPPGSYLEICGPATSLVARTIWVKDGRFGVRTQDRIDVNAMLAGGRMRAHDPASVVVRPVRAPAPQQSYQRSRHRASAFEYAAAILVILAAAATVGILLNNVFAAPIRAVVSALGG